MTTTGEFELFVPGRVALVGEHSDWAGSFRRFNSSIVPGLNIVTGTNAGLFAKVKRHPSSLLLRTVTDKGEEHIHEIPFNAKALLDTAREGGFWSYAAGVAYRVMMDYRVSGLSIDNYRTTLPLKKGLSSSAAICVLVARAFNRAYDLKITTRGEMELAYSGELMTPSRCGRMDQACAFGSRPVLMRYDADLLEVRTLRVPVPLHLVLVDLCSSKDTVEILAKLQSCFPFAQTEDQANVQKLLGQMNHDTVSQVVNAIESGDVPTVGRLMVEAQKNFDTYAGKVCPSQLTAPVLHKVLAHTPLAAHVYGGKGVGAGGDGTAQFLAKSLEDARAVASILENDFGMPSLFVTVQASQPIRTAVIPAAGFGADLFPATQAVKAELFPVIDPADGMTKPAILLTVEQLLQEGTGIEHVVIVVQAQDLPAFESLFKHPLPPQNLHRLSPSGRAYASKLSELGQKVRLVVQDKQEGFAHAVWCAKEAVGKEPFLVVLGDHLYLPADNAPSCAAQVLAEFARAGTAVVGLKRSPLADVSSFGCATGTWVDSPAEEGDGSTGHRVMSISMLCEKPSTKYAATHMQAPGLGSEHYLTAFGLYAVPPSIFAVLDDMLAHNIRSHGAFQFTDALEELRKREGLAGLVVAGSRFDLGTPEHFAETFAAFAALRAAAVAAAAGGGVVC